MIQLVIKSLPLAMSPSDAAEYIGALKLFTDMRAAGWIKPCPNARRKMVLFDRKDLEVAYARFYAGEVPKIG